MNALKIFVNLFALVVFILQVFAYLHHIYFDSVNPIFWYASNGYDHVLSVVSLIILFVFVFLVSKSDYCAVEALGAVMFVNGTSVLFSNYFVVHTNFLLISTLVILMLGWIMLMLTNREAKLGYFLFFVFEFVLWLVWKELNIPAQYYLSVNGHIIRGIYYWNVYLNAWIICAWYIQVLIFIYFIYINAKHIY